MAVRGEILMNKNNINSFSKYLSYLLRHNPNDIDLSMNNQGWVSVDELISNLEKFDKYQITFDFLKEVVDTDSKQRYSFTDDFKYIRANQGHSVDVEIDFKEFIPLGVLYHGTALRFVDEILNSGGLKPMTRKYVHLSKDNDTARNVGTRHGKPAILVVDAVSMYNDGYKFYESENGVVLVDEVPTKYLI